MMSRANNLRPRSRLTDVNKIQMTRLAKHNKEFGSQDRNKDTKQLIQQEHAGSFVFAY